MHEEFLDLLKTVEERSLKMCSWANANRNQKDQRRKMNRLSFRLLRLLSEVTEVRMELECFHE